MDTRKETIHLDIRSPASLPHATELTVFVTRVRPTDNTSFKLKASLTALRVPLILLMAGGS